MKPTETEIITTLAELLADQQGKSIKNITITDANEKKEAT